MRQSQNTDEKTKFERALDRRGTFLIAFSVLITFVTMLAGLITCPAPDDAMFRFCTIVFLLGFLAFAFLSRGNLFLYKNHSAKWKDMDAAATQKYIIEHRDSQTDIISKKLADVKRCRILTCIYAVFLTLFSLVIAFCIGVAYHVETFFLAFYFMPVFYFLCGLSRIHFPWPSVYFKEDQTYVSSEDFPELYALAHKAADTLHCKGNIRISILSDCNAGIAKVGKTYSIQLGAFLLNILSKEELFTVLLHEMAHIAGSSSSSMKELDHYNWLRNDRNPNALSGLVSKFFLYPDSIYCFHYSLYQYASSLENEKMADRVMSTFGNPQCAASALLKLKYTDLFSWEKGTYDAESFYVSEEFSKNFLETEIEQFKNALSHRQESWYQLIDNEILSRNASHPTLKMRLEILGVSNPELRLPQTSDAYAQECFKAVRFFEELSYSIHEKYYKERRKQYYLNYLDLVNAWESDGKPLIPEAYRDVDHALRNLGRVTEANQLCERAICELPANASHYAYFMKGCYLLHSYDPAGLNFIYHAIENNSNYIDEGLDVIGSFCCLVGREDDLEIYRQRAIELAQKQADYYDEVSVLQKWDHLTGEQLPAELYEAIMQYIASIDHGHIAKIYLVRKIITNDFFTSAFVIRFEADSSEEIQEEILHKIFSYLDTCSDWQFSLFHYDEVKDIPFDEIENSCVYTK